MNELENFTNTTFRLDGRVAIVTGGASGLGAYYSKALLASGASVLVVSRSKKGWETIQDFATAGKYPVAFYQQDITADGAAQAIAERAVAEYGTIDILVNNAGIQIRNEWQDFKDADWRKVIDVNLNAAYYLSHAVAEVMTEHDGGKIINIGSMQSFLPGKYIFPYAAAKHGIVGLTKAYAEALAPHNIQVNALAPGYIDTPMTKALQEDPVRSVEILDHIPAGHWAQPQELMGTLVFLASAASNYVTGITVPVDGGYLLR